ncbi:MAG: phosphatase PAP2 family protein [Pseudomonadota bacterium]|nr:phosphatase PAP2 family protein [Pseudomonadota bacterium]
MGLLVTVPYLAAGSWVSPQAPPLQHVLDAQIPFVPESVWVYLPGYWACFVIPVLVIREARSFRAALTGLSMLTVLALPFFLYFPVPAPRPSVPMDPSLTSALVRWLYSTDPASNTFPSLHVANATFCAMVTTAADRRWGAVVWVLAAGVCVSVLTLKQHWVVDIPAGWGLAAVGIATWRAQLDAPSVLARLLARFAGWLPARVPTSELPRLQSVRSTRRRPRA